MEEESFYCIQVDFAENNTCSFQREIQSVHWNQHIRYQFLLLEFIHMIELKQLANCSDLTYYSKKKILGYPTQLLTELNPESGRSSFIF